MYGFYRKGDSLSGKCLRKQRIKGIHYDDTIMVIKEILKKISLTKIHTHVPPTSDAFLFM